MSWKDRIRTYIGSVNQFRRRINSITNDSPFLIGLYTGAVTWFIFPLFQLATSKLGYEWTAYWALGSYLIAYTTGYWIFPRVRANIKASSIYLITLLITTIPPANLPHWPELREGVGKVGPYVLAGVIGYLVISYILRRWGEVIEERLIEIVDKARPWVAKARRYYQWLRQTYSLTTLWLLVHLIPLWFITMAEVANRFLGTNFPVGNLLIAAAAVMALEAAIYMYLMREWMKRSVLFAAAASIIIFKPWEDPVLMTVLGLANLIAILAILSWHPDRILERIKRELELPFEAEMEDFLETLKTPRGFLLILSGILMRSAQRLTELVQDWYLQVNVKQLIMFPINLVAVMGVALLVQYPDYQPLDEFTPKAVSLTRLVMLFWAALWLIRWSVQVWRRFSSIIRYAQEAGFSGNVLGNLVTVWVIISLGLATTAIGYRFVPSAVGEGTAWFYAEALPYFENVGEFAARLIGTLI